MATLTDLACPWCGDRPCVGDGYLNDAGVGDACGATDHHREGGSIDDDYAAHGCCECGQYVCGIHALAGGLCPGCGDPAEAEEVLASGQIQSRFLS